MRQRLLLLPAVLLVVLLGVPALWLLRPGGGAHQADAIGSRDAVPVGETALEPGVDGPALAGHPQPLTPPVDPPMPRVPDPVLDPQLEDTGRIEPGANDVTGRVVTADGVPVQGATVRAYGAGAFPLVWGKTKSTGHFLLDLRGVDEPLRLVVVPLQIQEPGARPRAAAVLEGVRCGSRDLDLVLPTACWVTGRVVDAEGQAVRATVKAYRDPTLQLGSVVTELDGSFRLAVAPGPVRLYAEPRGIGGPAATPGVAAFAPVEDLQLVCPAARTLRGRLRGEGDLSAFHVGWAYRLPDGSTCSVHVTPRSSDAAFELPGAPFAPLTVMATCKGDSRCAVRALGAQGTDVGDLVLARGLEIGGWLRATDGAALPPAVLEGVVVHARHTDLGVYWQCDVEGDGTFTLRGLLPGRYDLSSWLRAFRVDRLHAVQAPSGRIVLNASR